MKSIVIAIAVFALSLWAKLTRRPPPWGAQDASGELWGTDANAPEWDAE